MADPSDFLQIGSFDFGPGSENPPTLLSLPHRSSPSIEPYDFLGLGLGLPNHDHDVSFEWFAIGSDPDPNPNPNPIHIPLCWDCLRLDDDEEFEWEIYDENSFQEEEVSETSNWEVLEYDDVIFSQFQDQEGPTKCSPAAAKSAVEALPSADVAGSPANCAVCKDEILVEEKAKKLPCDHCYHDECILPWLGMRNTCPLCRYELPTDDAEYERRKARRGEGEVEEESVRYDFETLPVDSLYRF